MSKQTAECPWCGKQVETTDTGWVPHMRPIHWDEPRKRRQTRKLCAGSKARMLSPEEVARAHGGRLAS